LTGFIVGFTVILFDKIDIMQRSGIFAASEILADLVTQPIFYNIPYPHETAKTRFFFGFILKEHDHS